jgi:hypothetical protein
MGAVTGGVGELRVCCDGHFSPRSSVGPDRAVVHARSTRLITDEHLVLF